MKCPKCGTDIAIPGARYDFRLGCPVCGWQHSPDSRTGPSEEGQYDVSPAELVVCWILTLLFVGSPYAAIWYFAQDRVPLSFFTKGYWVGWGVYLLLAFVLSPRPDMENIGWLGGLIVRPFDFDQYWNRYKLRLALLLAPGKIVIAALLETLRLLAARLLRRPKAVE
jgi:MFS family permease